jgi:hypothetical protein
MEQSAARETADKRDWEFLVNEPYPEAVESIAIPHITDFSQSWHFKSQIQILAIT